MNMSCRSNRWHVCPLQLWVLRHEAPNSRRHPTGQRRTGVTAGHPSQSCTGRDSCGGHGGCGQGVVAMDGVNVVTPSEYSVAKASGRREPEAAQRFESGVWPSRRVRRRGMVRLRRGTWEPVRQATEHRLGLRSARSAHAGHRTSNVSMGKRGDCSSAGRALHEHRYSWWTKVALVLALIGPAVVGSPLWLRLSPNTMCAAGCGMPRLR
jgi:hypothetical protein